MLENSEAYKSHLFRATGRDAFNCSPKHKFIEVIVI